VDPQPTQLVPRRSARRDALRNDAIVIGAARAVFAEQGPQASMEAIATRAGLGIGTIYRRFSGKEALLEAIAQSFVKELDEAARVALANPDPGQGLELFLEYVGAFNAERRRYAAALIERAVDDDVSTRTTEKVRELTEKAVDSGALAQGVTGNDIKALIVALRGVVSTSAEGDDTAWRRFLRIHLTGLRVTSR
jgi:AcrR family transcriptional regulator